MKFEEFKAALNKYLWVRPLPGTSNSCGFIHSPTCLTQIAEPGCPSFCTCFKYAEGAENVVMTDDEYRDVRLYFAESEETPDAFVLEYDGLDGARETRYFRTNIEALEYMYRNQTPRYTLQPLFLRGYSDKRDVKLLLGWIEEAVEYVGCTTWSPSLESDGRKLLAAMNASKEGSNG